MIILVHFLVLANQISFKKRVFFIKKSTSDRTLTPPILALPLDCRQLKILRSHKDLVRSKFFHINPINSLDKAHL